MSFDILSRRLLAWKNLKQRQESYQVVESEFGQLSGLDAEVLERLGSRVDVLVDKLPLNFIGAHGGPPEVLVQKMSSRLEDTLGNVDVAATLDDFAVDERRDLSGGVFLRAVKLKGRSCSGIVV